MIKRLILPFVLGLSWSAAAEEPASENFRLRGGTLSVGGASALQSTEPEGELRLVGFTLGEAGSGGISTGGNGTTVVTLGTGFWYVVAGVNATVPLDSDQDGILDSPGGVACQSGQSEACSDNCPFEPNNAGDDIQRDTNGNGRGDACECGNADGNTTVNIFDALHIAQGTLVPPLVSLIHPRACDADGNGTCDIFDALRVAQGTLVPPLAEIVQECEAATVAPASP